jgi:hypothetical protein
VQGETGSNQMIAWTTAPNCPVTFDGASLTQDRYTLIATDPTAPVTIESADGDDILEVGGYGAKAVIGKSLSFGSINVYDLGQVDVTAGKNSVLATKSLLIGGTGGLNLNDNDFILDSSGASQLDAVRAMINGARNAGWGTSGLTSATAHDNPKHNTGLGAMTSTEFKSIYGPGAAFDGQPIDDDAVLVKYTYNGDANFDGRVTFDDYTKIDTGFNQHRTGWSNGDFNGDGTINFDDYVLIDTAFNTQGAAL